MPRLARPAICHRPACLTCCGSLCSGAPGSSGQQALPLHLPRLLLHAPRHLPLQTLPLHLHLPLHKLGNLLLNRPCGDG